MRVIISPAKKMVVDQDDFSIRSRPQYLHETKQLLNKMQRLSYQEAQKLWKTSEQLTQVNYQMLHQIDLKKQLTPALFCYSGIQYQYMAPDVLSGPALDYLQETLRILSGFYGILRPFDGIAPYRLEMGAKLQVKDSADLYAFWGPRLYAALAGHGPIINLASKEYSRALTPYLKANDQFIEVTFAHLVEGKLKTRATPAKIARGQMVRFIAEEHVTKVDQLAKFQSPTYSFDPQRSTAAKLIFIAQ
ncbi:hypothetical protein LFYK43_17910 [Ligilactobacillus salitolerans]|uniref:UPF0246 protein LFYK43_17910 n=1 Tax=Ligilactobacillus salitolerans TaxID=1808352 RepID=A0A401IUX4_9LACO|nr:peroxide stress protein YaaA [Ligilactobacillus salitolerans]GBG95332.1 hypothetical protein LFYK43_17910 [Ligilactobacillus salitolerans]